jgi:hypothetical protein
MLNSKTVSLMLSIFLTLGIAGCKHSANNQLTPVNLITKGADWFDIKAQGRQMFQELLDNGSDYTKSTIKPYLLSQSKAFGILYPTSQPVTGLGIKFSHDDWLAWDSAIGNVPAADGVVKDELRTKLNADRQLLQASGELGADALFCRLLKSFEPNGSASESGNCPAGPTVQAIGSTSNNVFASWDFVDTIHVEGKHMMVSGETCDTRTHTATNPNTTWEHDQQLLHQDKDSHWEFSTPTQQTIVWHVCASNCMFSCDEITLQTEGRIIPIPH